MTLIVRTLFISDVHLGARGCQAHELLDFLKHCKTGTIYLIGDIVDGWRLKSSWYWPQAHNDVMQKMLRRVRKGARVIYVPGNHDEFLREYVGSNIGGVEIAEEAVHELADGRRLLVLHGDKFDTVVRNIKWLAHLDDWAYDFAIFINGFVVRTQRMLGLPYWSFSAYAKQKVKTAVNFISAFEDAFVADAHRNDVHGVICGHIHHPAFHRIGGIDYINTGEWVESCTAVVEHFDGRLELIRWRDLSGDIAHRPQDLVQPVAA